MTKPYSRPLMPGGIGSGRIRILDNEQGTATKRLTVATLKAARIWIALIKPGRKGIPALSAMITNPPG